MFGNEPVCVCPRCDGQGHVYQLAIKTTQETIFTCDECEATWEREEAIGPEAWHDYQTFMNSRGLTGQSTDEIA